MDNKRIKASQDLRERSDEKLAETRPVKHRGAQSLEDALLDGVVGGLGYISRPKPGMR